MEKLISSYEADPSCDISAEMSAYTNPPKGASSNSIIYNAKYKIASFHKNEKFAVDNVRRIVESDCAISVLALHYMLYGKQLDEITDLGTQSLIATAMYLFGDKVSEAAFADTATTETTPTVADTTDSATTETTPTILEPERTTIGKIHRISYDTIDNGNRGFFISKLPFNNSAYLISTLPTYEKSSEFDEITSRVFGIKGANSHYRLYAIIIARYFRRINNMCSSTNSSIETCFNMLLKDPHTGEFSLNMLRALRPPPLTASIMDFLVSVYRENINKDL
jgi:hypothetical protein